MSASEMQTLTVALTGNPNVGKSTLFNALTGMNQHTGNWPGKTVSIAQGKTRRGDTQYHLIDLPGTYSLDGKSEDEKIAGEYIAGGQADCTVVVCDGSCLERSLNLALQILNRTDKVVICVNLMDEARKHGIDIDGKKLAKLLRAPVVLASAGNEEGLEQLLIQIRKTAAVRAQERPEWEDPIADAEQIAAACMTITRQSDTDIRRKVDRLLVSRRFGVPFMILLLTGIIWLTVWGANYPSALLQSLFDVCHKYLNIWLSPIPTWLRGIVVDGVFATSARVISVMLPPMMIFFPLFTVLEDIGYLPRMAFLLDPYMARCGGCGKQALTMCMGLGCNAVGVMGCRIIDSPRERLAAILTNAMIPCNGRFPTLIILGSVFFPSVGAAFLVAACVALGAVGAACVSGLLCKTALRHQDSSFVMEMPPFRRARLGKILVRSVLDRIVFVAGRALAVAAPAGAVLWLVSNTGIMAYLIDFLEPVGAVLGMNGVILLAFFLSLPANELLIPIIAMGVTQAGTLIAAEGVEISAIFAQMDIKMALCCMVFTLFHWPCSTTLATIYRETGSMKKTAAAFFVPTAVGCVICMVLNLLV